MENYLVYFCSVSQTMALYAFGCESKPAKLVVKSSLCYISSDLSRAGQGKDSGGLPWMQSICVWWWWGIEDEEKANSRYGVGQLQPAQQSAVWQLATKHHNGRGRC